MVVEISSENQKFLDAAVASGAFSSPSAALDRAVELMRNRQRAIEQIRSNPVPLPPLPPVLVEESPAYVSVRGHRIGLNLILTHYFAGNTEAELEEWFPTLSKEKLREILAFIRANSDILRDYLEQQDRLSRLLSAEGPRGPTLEELRARWKAMTGRDFRQSCP